MNSTIKNPVRHSQRTVERAMRRTRPAYPAITTGSMLLVNRPECGETRRFLPVDHKAGRSPTQHLSKQFVFARFAAVRARSIYTPHVGNKQLAKQGE